MFRKLMAECFGTFWLVLGGAEALFWRQPFLNWGLVLLVYLWLSG